MVVTACTASEQTEPRPADVRQVAPRAAAAPTTTPTATASARPYTDPILEFIETDVRWLVNEMPASRAYCAYDTLGTADQQVFIWASCSSGPDGMGLSVPVALTTQGTGRGLTVTSFATPGDGSFYSKDVRRLFPRDVATKVFNHQSQQGALGKRQRAREKSETS